jgi:hypothetical protein
LSREKTASVLRGWMNIVNVDITGLLKTHRESLRMVKNNNTDMLMYMSIIAVRIGMSAVVVF